LGEAGDAGDAGDAFLPLFLEADFLAVDFLPADFGPLGGASSAPNASEVAAAATRSEASNRRDMRNSKTAWAKIYAIPEYGAGGEDFATRSQTETG
jgi:hypothetical protein